MARVRLSRERILDAALELIDAEGLDAMSMRTLAARLGVQAMSLYHQQGGSLRRPPRAVTAPNAGRSGRPGLG